MNDLKVKLEKDEWIKLNFILGYQNPIVLFMSLIGLVTTFFVINYLTTNTPNFDSFPFFPALFGVMALIFLPVSTFIQANKNFKSNKWINQKLTYRFTPNEIFVIGETFNLRMQWTDVHSIKEMNNWFIIFTEKQQGLYIPKNRFLSKDEVSEFRILLSELNGVNKALK